MATEGSDLLRLGFIRLDRPGDLDPGEAERIECGQCCEGEMVLGLRGERQLVGKRNVGYTISWG